MRFWFPYKETNWQTIWIVMAPSSQRKFHASSLASNGSKCNFNCFIGVCTFVTGSYISFGHLSVKFNTKSFFFLGDMDDNIRLTNVSKRQVFQDPVTFIKLLFIYRSQGQWNGLAKFQLYNVVWENSGNNCNQFAQKASRKIHHNLLMQWHTELNLCIVFTMNL